MSFIVNRSAYKRDNIICEFDDTCEDINWGRIFLEELILKGFHFQKFFHFENQVSDILKHINGLSSSWFSIFKTFIFNYLDF